jgi:hypothetical protein
VRPFKRKHILKDSVLHAQFDDAQRLLAQLRAGVTPTAQPDSLAGIATEAPIHQLSQVFDLQLAARQYALTDLFAAYHSLIWHNRRFYFNPVTQRLEPVVFDGFSGPENDTYIPYPFWGYKLHGQSRDDAAYRDATSVNVFQDRDFVRAYYQQLERYCAPAFLDSIFVELAPQIEARAHFLRQAYFGYRLDKQMLLQNAAKIRSALSDGLREDHFFLEADAGAHQLRIRNHNPLPVELWVESQFWGPQRQFLEANCGQTGQIEAHFDLEKGTPVYYCLPGSTFLHRLHWDK